jgi:small-conductance mechanosensitive channel
MFKIKDFLLSSEITKSIVLSLVLLIISTIIKKILIKKLDKEKNFKSLEKVEIIKSIKTYVNIIFTILLIALWFSHIQSVLVSLFAVAAAIVIATKEVIMSVMGGFLIKVNNHFKVGDRIEIDEMRGFVVEKGITTTKILEMGPEKNSQQTTGGVITIPNSLVLSHAVKNESYFKNYSIKSFNFKLPEDTDFEEFEKSVLDWGTIISKDYIENAEKYIGNFCKKEGLVIPSILPRTKVVINSESEIEILLKIAVENNKIADIEQSLLRKYCLYLNDVKKKSISELG